MFSANHDQKPNREEIAAYYEATSGKDDDTKSEIVAEECVSLIKEKARFIFNKGGDGYSYKLENEEDEDNQSILENMIKKSVHDFPFIFGGSCDPYDMDMSKETSEFTSSDDGDGNNYKSFDAGIKLITPVKSFSHPCKNIANQ